MTYLWLKVNQRAILMHTVHYTYMFLSAAVNECLYVLYYLILIQCESETSGPRTNSAQIYVSLNKELQNLAHSDVSCFRLFH